MTKADFLEMQIVINNAEIDASFEAMKRFASHDELTMRIVVLQSKNKILFKMLKELND